MKGYVQVYTGNCKTKQTASLGLALRAAGAGLNVYIVQFLEKGEESGLNAFSRFKNVTIEQYGLGDCLKDPPSAEDIAESNRGVLKICEVLRQNRHDLVIAQELSFAVTCRLISEKAVLELIDLKPENVELVITGRGATQKMLDKADLVTELEEVRLFDTQKTLKP